MKIVHSGGQGIVTVSSYTMDDSFEAAWERRWELGEASIAGATDPDARSDALKMSAERVLVGAMAQGLKRGSRVLILEDLVAACATLDELWPYCHDA